MSDGRKRILSHFVGVKNAWNNTREKYIPVKRRQNLAVTDRGSCHNEEWLEEILDSNGALYNGNDNDNDDESYHGNNEQQQLLEGFANSCYKIVPPIFCFIILFV